MIVLDSVKAVQSKGEPALFVADVGSDDALEMLEILETMLSRSGLLSLLDSELHGGHRMSAHRPAGRQNGEERRVRRVEVKPSLGGGNEAESSKHSTVLDRWLAAADTCSPG